MGKLAELLGRRAMSIARRLPVAHTGGVIVGEHTLTAEQVRFHVDVLGRWFDFIHHDELLDRLLRPRSRPFCLLTFDDGKRSNATEAAPELERLGVPATFYVAAQFLSDGQPLWFDRRDAVVGAIGRTPPDLDLATLKALPLAQVHERIDRACAQYGVDADAQSDDVRPMSWDEARELARRGFTIGAHGWTHAIATNEPECEAMRDIERSIAEVSSQIGVPCATYAFPNGNYTARLACHALHAGAQTVMTTEPMWADRRFPPWSLPRLQLFGGQTRAWIELKLALAATGRLLVNPDGTGRRYRFRPAVGSYAGEIGA